MKKLLAVILALLMITCVGCHKDKKTDSTVSAIGTLSVVDVSGKNLPVNGSVITITKPGTYTVSGEADEAQIVVESLKAGDVVIVLSGVKITSSKSAPIYIKEAEKTIIELVPGTENIIIDNRSKAAEEPNAAIFSHDDMKINGEGSLVVNANENNGITSKDKLTIENGNITVNSENHGIRGKDRLKIKNGIITVNSGHDGLRSTNDTEADRGEVLIENGVINIKAADDAIFAYNMVNIINGTFTIDTDNNAIKAENSVNISGGTFEITTDDKDFACDNVTVAEGVSVTVNGEKKTY